MDDFILQEDFILVQESQAKIIYKVRVLLRSNRFFELRRFQTLAIKIFSFRDICL